MFDSYKELIITSTGCDDYTTLLRRVNLQSCRQYACNGNARINRMDRAGICAHFGCNGSCMEDWQASAVPTRGSRPLMDYYTIAGLAAMTLVAGLVGVRLAKDERLLRRKRVLIE
jgi:hypothetical protein